VTKGEALRQFGGSQFSTFKQALTDIAVEKLAPIAAETRRLMDDPGHIDKILSDGARRAHTLADPILRETKQVIGLLTD
jgi:tryptophanyl-tRNA synthetase